MEYMSVARDKKNTGITHVIQPYAAASCINSHKFTHAYMLMAPTTETYIFQVQVQS